MSLDVNISEPEEFNNVELHSAIKEAAELKGINDFTYHVDYISGNGENFIANIFRVLLKENGNEKNCVNVIVKTLVNTTRQQLFHDLHEREVFVYNDIVPKFKEIQKILDEKDRLILPDCILARSAKGNEVIILEDLTQAGFEMDEKLVKYEQLSYEQVSIILKELAKFHGLSFAMIDKDADGIRHFKTNLPDIIFSEAFLNKTKLDSYFKDTFNNSINIIDDLNAKKLLQTLEPDLLSILRKYLQPRKYNVLCHGDCWINNILFKQQTNESRVCFIDFQAMRYASPVTDIIYFLYLCTDSAFRSQHFKDLLRDYYDSLKNVLKLYNIDVNEVYPKAELDNDIDEYLPYGLLIALLELRITTVAAEDELDKESTDVLESDLNTDHGLPTLFVARVNDVVKESVDNGVLDRLFPFK